jgi:hypothetical protein
MLFNRFSTRVSYNFARWGVPVVAQDSVIDHENKYHNITSSYKAATTTQTYIHMKYYMFQVMQTCKLMDRTI